MSEIIALRVNGLLYGVDEIQNILNANIAVGRRGMELQRRNRELVDEIYMKAGDTWRSDETLTPAELEQARARASSRSCGEEE